MVKPNIDRKGRIARLITGLLTLAAASVVGWLWYTGVWPSGWAAAGAGVLIAYGLFQIYEAWAGWCIMRAMGCRTPM